MRQRFKLGAILAAIGAMFRTRELQRELAPVEIGDEFSHPRHKHSGVGKPNIRKHRRLRNTRNEMAFQSRKRNRA